MKYLLKNQTNAMGTYVIYSTQKIPQKCYSQEEGDKVVFDCSLDRAFFLTKLMLPGFGGAYLFADNCGEGYAPSEKPVDFYFEAARSRLYALKKYALEVQGKYGFLPKEEEERINLAENMLSRGELPEQDCLQILSQLLWAGEGLVDFDSRNSILKNGLRKDFLLGCSTKGYTQSLPVWRNTFTELFNYCCVPLHWGVVEPTPNEKHYEVIDDMIRWAREEHMIIRGHALVWFCPIWEKQNWMAKLSFLEAKHLVLERVENLMKAHAEDFDYVDFNEPMQSDGLDMTFDQHFEIVKEAYEIVKKYAPSCKIMINFFNEWQEFFGIDREELLEEYYRGLGLSPSKNEWSVSVYDYIDRCLAEGMEIDVLGFQFHDHPYDLFGARELILQWYNRYKIPLQITELEVPSGVGRPMFTISKRPNPAPELYWHEPWNEAIQAEWMEKFLTLCYSMPEVEGYATFSYCDAPTQWADYVEGYPAVERFKVGAVAYAGLLDENHRAKQAYYTLLQRSKELSIKKIQQG